MEHRGVVRVLSRRAPASVPVARKRRDAGEPAGGRKRRHAKDTSVASPQESAEVFTKPKRRLEAALGVGYELMGALSLVTHVYEVYVRWCDEEALDDLASTLVPHLMPWLHTAQPRRDVIVLGDPLQRTIYLSRRALRLLTRAAERPVALECLQPLRSASRSGRWRRADQAYPFRDDDLGPAARLERLQTDGLMAVAAHMTLGIVNGQTSVCHVVTAPISRAELRYMSDDSILNRVLTLRRASAMTTEITTETLTPHAAAASSCMRASGSGPLRVR